MDRVLLAEAEVEGRPRIDDKAAVVIAAADGWRPGVVGIVAAA